MKNILFIILLMLSGTPVRGQIQDYRAYQQSIHAAELHLVRGQKQEALDKYQEVLSTSKGNFVKDINNALVLADELEEADRFFELLNLLLSKHLSNAYLNEMEVFENWHADVRWQAFLAANEKAEVLQPEVKAQLEKLARDDQHFRLKRGSYKVYGDTIKHIDSVNFSALLELMASDQFPGETDIGVRDLYGSQPPDIIFHHYCQSTSVEQGKMNITPALINLVLAGKVLPNKCSLWLEMQKGDFPAGIFSVLNFRVNGEDSDWYVQEYTPQKLMLVEQTRQLLGMEPLEDYYEKIRFNLANPDADYVFDMQLSTFEISKSKLDQLTKNMRKL